MTYSKFFIICQHLFVWGLLYFIFVTNVTMVGEIKYSHSLYPWAILLGTLFNATIFYTLAYVVLPTISKGVSIPKVVVWSFLVLLFVSILETIIDYGFFIHLKAGQDKDYLGQFISCLVVNFFVLTIGASYGLIKIWRNSERQKVLLSKETLRAELDFLKAQVNPHFLFNVLNMAYSSANKNEDQETADIIEELANMMRYMLYESNVHKIALEKEIQYLQSFVNLQKKRLSSEVLPYISFDVVGSITNYQIAPLLLIPFVENAFKHGVRMGNATFINIRLEVTPHLAFFEVKNSISKNSNELESQYGGVGLENVKKRLDLLYPNLYELAIKEEEKEFSVALKLSI